MAATVACSEKKAYYISPTLRHCASMEYTNSSKKLNDVRKERHASTLSPGTTNERGSEAREVKGPI